MKRFIPLLFVFLSACSTTTPRHLPPVVEGSTGKTVEAETTEPDGGPRAYTLPAEEEVVAVPLEPPPASPSGGGAVVALLDQAQGYHSAGDIGNEAATIERALRIEPNNAGLWTRLAAVRLEQGRPQQAEQLALKSNALAGDDRALKARNWRLVARARWAVNDSAGARAAEKKARDFGG
jgi:tetratricopeptide (TPR) repeat protein